MATTTPRRGVPGTDVFARTIPLLIERHSFGEHRKASMLPVTIKDQTPEEEAATKSLLKLSKRLINSPELKQIRNCDGVWRDFLIANTARFRPGLYLTPVGNITIVEARARQWETDRQALVEKAALAYPKQVQDMRGPLGPLFNERDYPTVDRFKAQFWVDWRFINFGVNEVLKEVRADIFRRESEKAQRAADEARAMIEQHRRGMLLKITQHLRSLLAPKASGKRANLQAGSFDRLAEYLKTVDTWQAVAADGDLVKVVTQLKVLAKGLDLEVLRTEEALRDKMAVEMGKVEEQLTALVVDAPARGIRLRDDEEQSA